MPFECKALEWCWNLQEGHFWYESEPVNGLYFEVANIGCGRWEVVLPFFSKRDDLEFNLLTDAFKKANEIWRSMWEAAGTEVESPSWFKLGPEDPGTWPEEGT